VVKEVVMKMTGDDEDMMGDIFPVLWSVFSLLAFSLFASNLHFLSSLLLSPQNDISYTL